MPDPHMLPSDDVASTDTPNDQHSKDTTGSHGEEGLHSTGAPPPAHDEPPAAAATPPGAATVDATPAEMMPSEMRSETSNDGAAGSETPTPGIPSDAVHETSPSADAAQPGSEPAAAPASAEQASEAAIAAAEPEAGASAAAPAAADSFSQLFEATSTPPPRTVTVGQRIRGKIVSIGDEHVLIHYGGRAEGILATSELRGRDSKVLLRVGDPISVSVSSADEPVALTLGKKRGVLNAAKLRLSFENKQPVSGVVKGVNKGGFDVRVGGVRAFCPLSQIDNAFVPDPKTHLGQTYTFRILRWENGGRNIVLSRRAILKQEAEVKASETRQKLEVGAEFDGTVTRVQPFGAFVDIGGLEGLLHVSRLKRGHVQDATQILAPGQPLRVRVTRIENPGSGKERIALASAEMGPDPWEQIGETLREGETVTGHVVRLTDFGIFVNLQPGVDGLVHISELAVRRATPEAMKEAAKPGDEVQVRVLRVDREKKRVSLSMRPPRQSEPAAAARPARAPLAGRPPRDRERERDRERDDNANAGSGSLTHTMAEQLGALRRRLHVRP